MNFFVKKLTVVVVLSLLLLSFQNCSPVKFSNDLEADLFEVSQDGCRGANLSSCSEVSVGPQCSFNGQIYSEGQTVKGFLSSAVPAGQACESEVRECKNGAFTGSYVFASCAVDEPNSCLFDGKMVPHGQAVEAFQNSTESYGDICVRESRTCDDGVLSGSFNYAACEEGAAASCLFNGQTVPHGGLVKAFASSSVSYGQSCASEDRICSNGTLSGSYGYGSCVVQSYTPVCRSVYTGETSEMVCNTYITGWQAVSYSSLYTCNGGGGEYSCAPIYQKQCGLVTTPQYTTVCD